MDLINSHYKECEKYVYECIYTIGGRPYEFTSDDELNIFEAGIYKGDLVVVVSKKPIAQKRFRGELAKINKITSLNQIL